MVRKEHSNVSTRTYPLSLYIGACAAVLGIAWLALVPRFTTGSTFLWMATVALALYAVTLMSRGVANQLNPWPISSTTRKPTSTAGVRRHRAELMHMLSCCRGG